MQQLHLVGFTTDLEGLIFSPRKGAKSGGYLVVLDDQLLDSIEDAQRLRDERDNPTSTGMQVEAAPAEPPSVRQRPKPHSELSPREIQARLRAGSTVADVASQAGVDQEWVLRFATPILAEQARVVERTQQMTFVKTRLGPSSQPLGTSVQWNLAEKGVHLSDDEYDAGWSAFNLHGTTWVVRFSFWSRKRSHTAEWEVDLRTAELTSRSRLASDLGYVEPGRGRKRPVVPEPGAGRESPARPSEALAAKKTSSRKKAAPAKRGVAGPKKTLATKPAKKSAGEGGPAAVAEAGGNGSATSVPVEPSGERPTHLARPPSPMNAANRVPARGRPAGAAFAAPAPGRRAEPSAPPSPPPLRSQTRPPRPPVPRPAPPAASDADWELTARSERRRPPPPREPEAMAEPERRPPPPGPELEPAPRNERRRPPPPPEPEAMAEPERRQPRRPADAADSRPLPAPSPPESPQHREPPPAVVILPPPEAERRQQEGRRPRPSPPAPPPTSDEPVWGGPGSGEPAPPVRIRADLADATAERQPEAPPGRRSGPGSRGGEGEGEGSRGRLRAR